MGSPMEATDTILLPSCFEVCQPLFQAIELFSPKWLQAATYINYSERFKLEELVENRYPTTLSSTCFSQSVGQESCGLLPAQERRIPGTQARILADTLPGFFPIIATRRTQIPHWNTRAKGCVMWSLRWHHSSSERMATQHTVFDPLHAHSTYAAFCWDERIELIFIFMATFLV